MKKLIAAVCFLLVGGVVFWRFRESQRPVAIAITDVTVVDGAGAPARGDQTVVIFEGRIVAVGPSGQVSIPKDVQAIDAAGKYLIPGLSDMHVHLTGAGEPTGSREFILPLLIANGVTTVRDMGGEVAQLKQLRNEIESGARLGPQIFFTGPYIDGDPPAYQPSIVARTPDDAREAVRELKAQGVDFIKTQSRLGRAAYFAVADECKKQKIQFVGHVPDAVTAAEASDTSQASIEHLTGVLLSTSSEEDKLRRQQLMESPANETIDESLARSRAWQRRLLDTYSPAKAEVLIHRFVANHTWQVPTFPILVHFGFMTPATDLATDPRMEYVPKRVREIWAQGRKERMERRSDSDFALREEIVKRSLKIVGEMNTAGVGIMAGTDTAAPNVIPGFSLHEDLAYLVEAGLTPMQALEAATRAPAEFLGQLKVQGTIAAGQRADLVLLDANPLEDIHNTAKIRAVILRGKLLMRADLDEILNRARKFGAKR